MSDALEALEWLCSYALMTDEEANEMYSTEPPGTFSRDWDRNVNAIRAALEQGEAVVWQYTGEDGEECYTTIKAKALQFDANPTPLYTAPPSTAEAQARALEDAADCGEFSAWAKDRLLKMAKRIREEW